MDYRVADISYGPDIRLHDWRAQVGRVESAGGMLHVFGQPKAVVEAAPDWLAGQAGPGGNIAQTLVFNLERVSDKSRCIFHFRFDPARGDACGLRFACYFDHFEVHCRDRRVFRKDVPIDRFTRAHELTVATLAGAYTVLLDGYLLAEGELPAPMADNRGLFHVELDDVDVRLQAFTEQLIKPAARGRAQG